MAAGRGAAARRAGAALRSVEAAPELPPFDVLESKIQPPTLRPGTVPRTPLINRLRAATPRRIATIIAPAGYGKTTLLGQWAERDPRPFVWVSVDERDNDPIVLLRHVAAALGRQTELPDRLLSALASPGASIWTHAVPRLAAALSNAGPNVLLLDDFSLLRSRASLEAVAALVDEEDEESMLAVAGRVAARLPLAPLRAQGLLFELGVDDLALSNREAHLLLKSTGVQLSDERAAELVDQCEGWAAALYLAALAIRDGAHSHREVAQFKGDDRYLADYFRSEYLSQLRPGPLRFLRRTSILERMSGPLCDAVLEDEGSSRELERIERANLFLVPLDNRREWYRYHHLFRELLACELAADEPALVPVLHRRAADWFEANGDDEYALEHAFEAGDTDRAAAILAQIAIPLHAKGQIVTLERWLNRFSRAGLLERYPAVCLQGCRIHLLRGQGDRAKAWLEAAERAREDVRMPDGSTSTRPWIANVRAWIGGSGAQRMLADAEAALAELPPRSTWRPSALIAQGSALALLGKDAEADQILSAAAAAAEAAGSAEAQAFALGERAMLSAAREDRETADALAGTIGGLIAAAGTDAYPARAVAHVIEAHMLLRHGRWNEARTALTATQELLPHLTDAIPWLAVQIRIELVRGLLTLRDRDAALEALDEIETILRPLPDLGVLAKQAAALALEAAAVPENDAGRSAGLTSAELRLLPLLATHFSFREIAEELHVSRNTIKTQAISVYRKLGVSSRSGAIEEAHRLGLSERLHVVISNDQ
jgi:LuxR family maltose regulon positive regulatory protein